MTSSIVVLDNENYRLISIKDSLPENSDIVIIVKMGFMSQVPYIAVYDSKRFYNIERMDEVFEKVTHWMPLPEMPNQE